MRWAALGLFFMAGCVTLPSAANLPGGTGEGAGTPSWVAPASSPVGITGFQPVSGGIGVLAGESANQVNDENDPLTLAADSLGRGDDSGAAKHFERHLRTHPDQLMFRVHLADLYLKSRRDDDAKAHYERFVADARDAGAVPQSQLVHCHTKLMEIAWRAADRFGERLHRGIGLVVLTRQETDDADVREEILCKALAALLEAKELWPTHARLNVYLAEAQDRAGNRRAAENARAIARNSALPGDLTNSEWRSVQE